jgi:Chain length determinant protein
MVENAHSNSRWADRIAFMSAPVQDQSPVPVSDELSLRDLYLVLRRWSRFILAFTLICVVVALIVSLLLPKVYVSKVTLSLGLNTASVGGSGLSSQLFNNLPSLPGLAKGFSDLLDTTVLTKELGENTPDEKYKAVFDAKNGLLTLSAKGGTAREAFENTEKFNAVTKRYFTDRIVSVIVTNIDSLLSRSKLDIANTQDNLRLLQAELKKTPSETRTIESILPTTGAAGGAGGALTARGVSPAYSTLSVQEATLRTSLAQSQALITALEPFKREPAELEKLVGQALQLQELVPAAEPLRADQPRPALYALIAGVLGLLIALIIPFIAEALRDPKLEGSQRKRLEGRAMLEKSTITE